MWLTLSRIWRRLSVKRRKKRSGRRSRTRLKLLFDVTSGVLYLREYVLCDESLYLLKCLFWQKSSNACSSFFFLREKKIRLIKNAFVFKVGLCDIQNDILQDILQIQFHELSYTTFAFHGLRSSSITILLWIVANYLKFFIRHCLIEICMYCLQTLNSFFSCYPNLLEYIHWYFKTCNLIFHFELM